MSEQNSAGKRDEMTVSQRRIYGLRAVLAVGLVLELIFGAWLLFFPKSFFDSFAQAGEPYTTTVRSLLAIGGTLTLCWVIAMAIAIKNVLGSRSLVQAIVAFLIITGVLGFYFDTFVVKAEGGAIAVDVLIFILGVLLYALYPWRQETA